MSLCELFVLYETVYTLPARLTPDSASLSLRSRLLADGVLKELDVSSFHNQIGRALVEALSHVPNLVAVAGSADHIRSPIEFPREAIKEFLLVDGSAPKPFEVTPYSKGRLDDLWGSYGGGGSSEIEKSASFEEMGRSLVGWIEYGSSGAYEHCTSVLRDMYYIYAAEQALVPYWPQFDRLGFARKFPNYWASFSLREQLYERLALALDATVSEVFEDVSEDIAYVPPFTSLVLERCSNADDFPEALLSVRDDYSKLRRQFNKLEDDRIVALSLTDRRRIRERQKELLNLAGQSFQRPSTVSLEAIIRYVPDLVKPLSSPLDPTKYSADLLLKPIGSLREWWKSRPISFLFRAANRVAEIERYETLLDRVLGINAKKLNGKNWRVYLEESLAHLSKGRTAE
jgi:hypothetical protein